MTNWYAGPLGSDSNNGLSPQTPKTLTGASRASRPGDTVSLLGGTYNRTSPFYPAVAGTPTNWITYRNYDSTEVIFNWTNSVSGHLIHFYAAFTDIAHIVPKYIEIRGITFDGGNTCQFAVFTQGCSHTRVINCIVRNCGVGGIAGHRADYVEAIGNQIHHCGYGGGWSSGVSFNSMQWTDRAPGFHQLVLNNVISGSYDGSTNHTDGNGIIMDISNGTYDPTTADTPPALILNNVVYGNGGAGITPFIVSNIWILNNTIYGNGLDSQTNGGRSGGVAPNSAYNCYFINNISYGWNRAYCYQLRGTSPLPGAFLAYYKELWWDGGGNNFTYSDPSQFIHADPQFVNPPPLHPTNDFQYQNALPPWQLGNGLQLKDTSPAIDAGIDPRTLPGLDSTMVNQLTLYATKDILGNARPQGGAWDLGAYEHIALPAPTVSGVSPNSGVQAQTFSVVVTGANFVSGATVSFGAGITTNAVVFNSAAQLTVNISIASGATVGTRNVVVTNPDTQTGTRVGAFTVTAQTFAPALVTVSPNNGEQGRTLTGVIITGSRFVNGCTVTFGAGITVNSVAFNSSTQLTVGLTIAPTAIVGARSCTVTNPDAQAGSKTAAFTVTLAVPTVVSSTPSTGIQGQTLGSVVVAGSSFQNGATVSYGAGITVNTVTFVSSTQLSVNLTIAGGATAGVRTVTVTNPNGEIGSLASAFTITAAVLPPVVSSVTPNTGQQGQVLTGVVIAGSLFANGASVTFGAGIAVNSVVFNSSTQLTVSLTVANNAAAGARTCTVTNPDTQAGNLPSAFTVTLTVPIVSSSSPNTGVQGQILNSVVITGSSFLSGATVGYGAGISVNSVTFNSSTQLTVNLTIGSGASAGVRTITVTNPNGQSGTLGSGFTITAAVLPPIVSNVSPATGAQGQVLTGIIVTGSRFVSGTTVDFGSGIEVDSTVFNSSTQLTVGITVAPTAAPGARTVTVTNLDLQAGNLSTAFTVTVTVPVVVSSTPNTGVQAQTFSAVIAGSSFLPGATVSYGAGITVNSVSVDSDIQITVNLTIDALASVGTRNVVVTNTNGQTGTRLNGFSVTAAVVTPIVTSSTPATGVQGQTLTGVVIGGSLFQSGATVSYGAGITVSSVIFSSSTQLVVNLAISGSAAVGTRNIVVTNPGSPSGTLVSGFAVSVFVPAPTLISVTDNIGKRGQTLDVVILGTGFVATPTVSFGSGITINSVSVADAAHLNVSISIANGASLGARTVVVTNPDTQGASLASAFTVILSPPTVVSISPNTGAQSHTYATVLITGTELVPGVTVSLGSGISVDSISSITDTTLTIAITIASSAALGTRNVTVTTPDAQVATLVAGFTVTAFAPGGVTIIDDFTLDITVDFPSLMIDPRPTVQHLYTQSASAVPFDGTTPSTFTEIDAVSATTIAQIASRNPWGSYGVADIDTAGNLYAQAPGLFTFTSQRLGKFTHDDLTLDILATTNGVDVWDGHVSGEIRVDRYSTHGFVVQWRNSDTTRGNTTVFDQETMTVVYDLPREDFGITGITSRRPADADFDDQGNLWMLIVDSGVTNIYKVTPDGTATLWGNISADFPEASYLMWVPQTNRLIIGRTVSSPGLWLWDIATQTSVGTGLSVTLLGGLPGNKSFHSARMTTSFWISNVYTDGTVVVPPGTLPDFPQFTEIDIVNFTVLRVLQFPAIAFEFPVRGMGFFFNPVDAVFSPEQNAIFSEESGGRAIGKFTVGPPPPPPAIRTTQIVAELVIRPHRITAPAQAPPPVYFDTNFVLQKLTGPARPMEVCGGYIGEPAILSQLFQVRAQYTNHLAPKDSGLLPYHTPQIGEADVASRHGVRNPNDSWFFVRQTDRYHRVCIVCKDGEAEVVGLTYMLREAGNR